MPRSPGEQTVLTSQPEGRVYFDRLERKQGPDLGKTAEQTEIPTIRLPRIGSPAPSNSRTRLVLSLQHGQRSLRTIAQQSSNVSSPAPGTNLFARSANTPSVTGTSTGIGRAIALRFSAEGAHVVCADVEASSSDSDSDGGAAHNAILNGGGSAQFVSTNVGCSQEVENLVQVTVAQHGRLDMYVDPFLFLSQRCSWMAADVLLKYPFG